MSLVKIAAALDNRLDALTPKLDTAKEGAAHTPKVGKAYQKVWLLPAKPDNSTLGGAHFIEAGVYQVTLFYPSAEGNGKARARAELLRNWFKRGLSFAEAGVNVVMTHTPQIGAGYIEGDRYCVVVSVRYQADIFP